MIKKAKKNICSSGKIKKNVCPSKINLSENKIRYGQFPNVSTPQYYRSRKSELQKKFKKAEKQNKF